MITNFVITSYNYHLYNHGSQSMISIEISWQNNFTIRVTFKNLTHKCECNTFSNFYLCTVTR